MLSWVTNTKEYIRRIKSEVSGARVIIPLSETGVCLAVSYDPEGTRHLSLLGECSMGGEPVDWKSMENLDVLEPLVGSGLLERI